MSYSIRHLHCLALLACLLGTPRAVDAATIVGGSALLTPAHADQLETWLGEGLIQLTNIYTKQTGDTSAAFHAAADGQGRTFSVIEVLGQDFNGQPQLIGGYNPQSWQSAGGFTITAADALRTAFLFNLSTGEIQRQNLNAQPGRGDVQTLNEAGRGPTFGFGSDIFVNGDMNSGYAVNYSYGGTEFTNDILAGIQGSHEPLQFGRLEVFKITPVPEPTALGAALVSSVLLVGQSSRRLSRNNPSRGA
jgi:hypothetical protein